MSTFLAGLALLALGYVFYGRFIAGLVRPDPQRATPATLKADGVDYVQMPTWRIYLVQLLNIAGLGPVFGPVLGALWGPQVCFWIVFGTLLGGATHDFLSGAMSMRAGGAGLPDLIGAHLGRTARQAATVFILVLMVLVGTVFVKGPAKLITQLLPPQAFSGLLGADAVASLAAPVAGQPLWLWIVMVAIFAYYLVATVLPVDKLIGRLYPVFALALIVTVAGLAGAMLLGALPLPTMTLSNLHPRGLATWPFIFVTVSCGAISGFHATQSPMMARCLGNERHMQLVFYGAMIAEGLIALIWAFAAQGYYGGVPGLAQALGAGLNNTAVVVYTICVGTMGKVGGMLGVLGVVVLPITSGDTAFRVARLILADYTHLPQARARNRYALALPVFAIAIGLNFVPFGVIWRYFGWANQTLAAVTLWTGAVYLAREKSPHVWVAALPATFMTAMTVTYLLAETRARGGVGLSIATATLIGVALAALALGAFIVRRKNLTPVAQP